MFRVFTGNEKFSFFIDKNEFENFLGPREHPKHGARGNPSFILSCTLRQLFSQLHCLVFLHFSKNFKASPFNFSWTIFWWTFMVILPTWTFFHVQFLHLNEQYFSESDVLPLLWFLGSFPSPFSNLKNSPKFRFCFRPDCPRVSACAFFGHNFRDFSKFTMKNHHI